MSQPNEPYGQGGQPSWPGPQGPYQQPDPYQQGGYQQSNPYQTGPQPNPYQTGPQPNPYQQSNPYQSGPQANPHQTGPQPNPYQTGPQANPYQQPNPYQAGPQQTQQFGQPDPYGAQQPPGGYGGPPTTQWSGYGPVPPEQPQRRRAGLMVGSLVAVIALVAAGVATYFFAFAGSAAGAESPKEAAVSLVDALSKNDVIGLLDGLAPGEGDVAKDYLSESLDELKRLQVVKQETKPEQITGIAFKAEELVFDDAGEEKVNDHLSITKLVDGKVTISSDWSNVPLTEKFLQKAFPDGVPASETKTYDVSDEIAKNDGQPVRIATVKVDGEWYPSLFYSIADAALQEEGKQWPAQPIGASGADSPEAAVRQFVEAGLRADVKRLIELTPPDEMAALHDAGQLLVEAAEGEEGADAELTDLRTKVEDVTGGKRVTFSRVAMKNSDGETFSVEIDGDCAKIDDDGEQQELCGKDLAEMIADLAELGGNSLTDEQLGAIERATVGYLHSGVVTTQVGGRWYVSPARTLGDITTGFLRGLQPGDLEILIDMVR